MKMITLSLRTVLLLLLWMATLTRTASPWQYTALSSEASSSTRPSLSRKGLSALACGGAGGSESGSVGLHVCCNTRTLILTVLRRCSFSSALSAKQHTFILFTSLNWTVLSICKSQSPHSLTHLLTNSPTSRIGIKLRAWTVEDWFVLAIFCFF